MNGILVVNKPIGMTSRDVVNRVQTMTRVRKCGHAGTLDPLASGVLVVCLGRATRLINYIQKMRKRYQAEFRFGLTSDTDDQEGTIEPTLDPVFPSEEELQQAIAENVGEIEQVPPQYSAISINGKRAYKLARQGIKVELKPRTVTITQFRLVNYTCPDWEAVIECGAGTYIRSLGRDLGERFGCGAMMTSLSREAIGEFNLQNAISLADLEDKNWQRHVFPFRAATTELKHFDCNAEQSTKIKHGIPLPLYVLGETKEEEIALINPEGELLAIAEINRQLKLIKPRLVFLGE